MFTCRDVSDQASAYLEGDLRLMDRLRMRTHLLLCENCRRFVSQIRDTADLLRLSLRARAADPALEAVVVETGTGRRPPPRTLRKAP